MAQNNADSTLSGGLMVVIGVVLALAVLYFFAGGYLGLRNTSDKPQISISMPAGSSGSGAPASTAPASGATSDR